MPLVDSNLQSTWDSLYRCRINGEIVHYVRAGKQQYFGQDHILLKDVLNIQPGQSIILVGAGFGWVAEDWVAAGLGPIAAIDTSGYIQTNKVSEATVTILNEGMETNASRGRVRQALGLQGNQRATWCISEDVLPILNDTEAQDLASRMRIVGTNVAHWISCGIRRFDDPNTWAGDPRLNWKTLEDWKALVTPDTVVARNEQGRRL